MTAESHPAERNFDGTEMRVAIVVARYHDDVARRLLRGATDALEHHHAQEPDIFWVPGVLELPVTALALAEKGEHDAIVCLGAVIRDETFHFEVASMQVAAGLMQVQLDTGVPIASGILMTEDKDQALARSGPKNNTGALAAEAALDMANVLRAIQG